ncbi:MAG: YihA family ribosome biogenesis GTP-binding protein, partial [Bacteroidales bacterium]|nr:YihA family ribosome biogenesis GTP-binding protein [Bacteroidales bacterium]
LVDLPGYGYARRGKENREKLREIIEDYVLERTAMTSLFVLVDSRHKPQAIDLEFMEWLGENGVPFSIVFTKGDKQGTGRLSMNVGQYKTEMLKTWDELPPIFVTSAETAVGKEDILKYIDKVNKSL